MNISSCFSIQEIPDYIRQKFKFKQKLWMDLGKNQHSAIMCSIIYFLYDKNIKQLEQVVLNIKPDTQTTLSFHSQLNTLIKQQGSLDNFFYNLRQIDSKNLSSGLYLKSYLSQKGIQYSIVDLFLKVSIEFRIQIHVYGSQGNPKKHGKEERNQIVLYNSGLSWYYIIQVESQLKSQMRQQNQEKECSYCHQQTSLSYSPACSHSICIDCLKKWFQSPSLQQIKCPFTKCPTMIERNRFLEFRDQLEKEKKQSYEKSQIICCKCKNQIEFDEVFQNYPCSHLCCRKCLSIYNSNQYFNRPEQIKCLKCQIRIDIGSIKTFFNISSDQLKQPKDQIQKSPEKCQKCLNSQVQEDLFENPTCKHKFCRSCLAKYTKNSSSNLCLDAFCIKEFSIQSLKDFQQKQPQSPQKIFNNKQDDSSSNIVGCSKCCRHQKSSEYYNNYCGHSYCQSCADEEIVKGKSYFVCYSSLCQEQIIVEDVQQYFYSQLENKNKKSCNLCYESYLPSSMFKNYKCDHYLCYNCVNKIAQKQLYNSICPVKLCKAYINAEELDQYFTEKQEEMLKEQLEKEEEDLKLKQVEEPKQQQQHPSSIQSQILDQTILNEDEIVRIAIENSLENQNQQNQLNQQSKIQILFENKSSQVIKAQEGKQKLFDDPKQVEKAKENMEIEGNNESEITQVLKQNIEGNCTFCRFPFSDFNLPQQLGCKKHRIGVCCLRYGIQCSQCIYQEIKQKEQAQPKKKFTIFQEESYYPHSPQYVTRDAEDAKPNSRLSSRIYGQPVQQNSGLYQSQALYTSTYAMRNASVGYGSYAISKRF